MPYHYDHFDPEFEDAHEHEPAKIALLCTAHHQEKTSKRLPSAEVARGRKAPYNANRDARWDIALGSATQWTFVGGGNRSIGVISNRPIGISINQSPILLTPGRIWNMALVGRVLRR
jgi:hypothetical protein